MARYVYEFDPNEVGTVPNFVADISCYFLDKVRPSNIGASTLTLKAEVGADGSYRIVVETNRQLNQMSHLHINDTIMSFINGYVSRWYRDHPNGESS